jgi:hypothetical protein
LASRLVTRSYVEAKVKVAERKEEHVEKKAATRAERDASG